MTELSDFKPLQTLKLQGIDALECSGLILIVGPNSSGKTQLLRDLYRRLKGDVGDLVVASEITLNKISNLPLFLSCLEKEGYIEHFRDDGNNEQVRLKATFVGSGEPQPASIRALDLQQWHSSYSNPAASQNQEQPWLNSIGRYLVTALFLERRLISANQTGVIDFEAQPTQYDLQALHLNDAAKEELLTEIRKVFGRSVWPDASKGNILAMRVSNSVEVPTLDDRLSPIKMMKYRTIESEGDGLKSYVATSMALLLGRRPVCLIDEPEMCLHPPQAYDLGRFIGRFGSSPDRVTFVATHSSHVLRGVIDASPGNLQILRLVRQDENFVSHLVESVILAESLKKPAVRAESVLDGIFAEAVCVVEADTDRLVYQAGFESLQEETRLDVHISGGEGYGAIANKCRLYRTLKIPVAVIADLDVLADLDCLKQILGGLVCDPEQMISLLERAKAIAIKVKAMPPSISPAEVKERLKNVLSVVMDWTKQADAIVRKDLKGIANDLDRMRRIKRGGIPALPTDIRTDAEQLTQDLACAGLFLVPVGELEEWFTDSEVSTSKARKPEWANEAAFYLRNRPPGDNGIWKFLRGVAKFLSS